MTTVDLELKLVLYLPAVVGMNGLKVQRKLSPPSYTLARYSSSTVFPEKIMRKTRKKVCINKST